MGGGPWPMRCAATNCGSGAASFYAVSMMVVVVCTAVATSEGRGGNATQAATAGTTASASGSDIRGRPRPIAPGVDMPMINLGGVGSGAHQSNWTAFLALGGRGIDTALTYGDTTQTKAAAAVAASRVPRAEIMLTTKVPCCPNHFGAFPGVSRAASLPPKAV